MAAKKEVKLRRELIVKELVIWVAVAIAVTAVFVTVLQKRSLIEEDNITGKIPSKVMSITFCFVSLSQEKII